MINTQKLEAMIRSLLPNMKYQFHVVAHNSRGTSAPSEVLQVTTLIEVGIDDQLILTSFQFFFFLFLFTTHYFIRNLKANVPGPPMSLEGHATSSMSITLSWEEPRDINGRISKYIITFMEVERILLRIN